MIGAILRCSAHLSDDPPGQPGGFVVPARDGAGPSANLKVARRYSEEIRELVLGIIPREPHRGNSNPVIMLTRT